MRVEQTAHITLATTSQSAITQKFPGLKTGAAIQVQVLGFSGDKLLLKIAGGTTLHADFKGEMLFLPQDRLDLILESRKGGKIAFRLTAVNGQSVRMEVSESEDALLRSGIEPTRQNLFLSGLLKQNGYASTPQNLENLSRIMQEYPHLPNAVSAFFASNNIEPDSDAVQFIQQLQEESSLLANRTNALITELRAYAPSVQSSQPGQPVQSAPIPVQSSQSGQPVQSAPTKAEVPAQPISSAPGTVLETFIQNLRAADPQLAQTLTASYTYAKLSTLPNLTPNELNSEVTGFFSLVRLSATQEKAVASALLAAYREPASQTAFAEATAKPVQITETDETLQDLQPRKNAFPSAGANPSAPSATGLLQKLSEFFVAITPADIQATAQSLRSAVQKQEKLAEEVQSGLVNLAGEKSVLHQQSLDVRSQIGLNGALENFFYFQIPLTFRQQSGTAELYVFERNRTPPEGRNDCTILIALDTQNMGRIETVLRSDGTGLDLSLRLQSDAVCRCVGEHASELKQSLSNSGFTVKNLSFGLLETKTTPVNAQNVFANLSSFTPGGLNIQV